MGFVLAQDTEVLETIILLCILVLDICTVGCHGALHDLFDLECGNIIMAFVYPCKIIMKEIIRFFSFSVSVQHKITFLFQ